ncbi:Hsp20/alpha crystallin family protein [Candidatus Hydrogenedentota bacterium]
MDLVKWDPFRGLGDLRSEMARLFGHVPSVWAEPGFKGWAPAVDILEDEKTFTIKIELPGVDKKDIEVSVTNGELTVRGERKLEKEDKKENYRRIERSYGSFSRSFTMPKNVDAKGISAESKEGVLTVTLPKTKAEKPKSGEKILVK